MKKNNLKRVFAAMIGSAMLMSCASGYAASETRVFKDDFENLSSDGTLAMGIPELKVYGADLMNGEGAFENAAANGSINGAAAGANFSTNKYASVVGNRADISHGGSNHVYVDTQIINNNQDTRLTYALLEGTQIKKGVYELSAWVKGFEHSSVPTSEGKTVYAKYEGNRVNNWEGQNISHMASRFGSTELSNSEWREIKCYIPFSADYTVTGSNRPTFSFCMEQFLSGDTSSRRFLIDDITMKRIENCDLVSSTDIDASSNLTKQNNVPYYKLSLASGKTAVLTYPVENKSSNAVDVTAICALYDGNGVLQNIIGNKKATVAAGVQTVITDTVNVPQETDDTYSIKYYLWDSLSGLYPYADKKDSTDLDYITKHNAVIPNTDSWQVTSAKNRYNSQQVLAESMDRIVSGGAHSGINNLYIPYPYSNDGVGSDITESGSAAYVMTDTLKANTTYRLKFYAKPVGTCGGDFFAVGVAQGDMRSLNAHNNSAWISNLKLVYTDTDGSEKVTNTNGVFNGMQYYFAQGYGASNVVRVYSNVPKEWRQYIFEFTSKDADRYSLDFQTAFNGNFYQNCFGGVYIDDVELYEITDSDSAAE